MIDSTVSSKFWQAHSMIMATTLSALIVVFVAWWQLSESNKTKRANFIYKIINKLRSDEELVKTMQKNRLWYSMV